MRRLLFISKGVLPVYNFHNRGYQAFYVPENISYCLLKWIMKGEIRAAWYRGTGFEIKFSNTSMRHFSLPFSFKIEDSPDLQIDSRELFH